MEIIKYYRKELEKEKKISDLDSQSKELQSGLSFAQKEKND